MRFKSTYILFLLLTMVVFVHAEKKHDPLTIKKTQWEKSVDGIDYTETYKEMEEEQPPEMDFDVKPLSYDWSPFKYGFYIIVVGLVLFLIIKILVNLNKNPNITKQEISIEALEEIEEQMHELNLNELLSEAIANESYHVALRINFLIIIKSLSENGHIKWAKEKTNWEYHSETKEVLVKDHFKEIIIAFEPVWYGEHVLTKEGYFGLKPMFDSFINQFDKHE